MKIIIIGKGHGWELAPKEGETWGMTQLILRRPVSLVVDMNDYSLWGPVEEREARCARELALKTGVPYIDLMNYPLESIKNVFQTDYFSNTVDYSIALALYRGCTELDFYGVNMASGSEYQFEKPGVEYWTGRAQGMGVKVRIFGEHSTILRTRDGKLYGYGTPQTMPRA